jgi:hypothetical protein
MMERLTESPIPIPSLFRPFSGDLIASHAAYPRLIFYARHDKVGHFAAWEQRRCS